MTLICKHALEQADRCGDKDSLDLSIACMKWCKSYLPDVLYLTERRVDNLTLLILDVDDGDEAL